MKYLLISLLTLSSSLHADVLITKGTVLTCPSNNKPMLKLAKDLSGGDIISVNKFEPLDRSMILAPGAQIPCNLYAGWPVVQCLHSQFGWLPKSRCSHLNKI